MSKILVIEDDPNDAEFFQRILVQEGNAVEIAATASAGLSRAQSGEFDLVLTDLNLGGPTRDEGRELVKQLHCNDPHLPVILMTGGHTAEIAIDAIKLGAFDYFSKPREVFDESFRTELAEMVDHASASRRLTKQVKVQGDVNTEDKASVDQIVGRSRSMQNVYKEIGRVAATSLNVLIRGETGTGKELVARAIWGNSDRAKEAFVVVNCAAIPVDLLESELFGHDPGAFTGARTKRLGRFELAHRGTLFLDEIGDMNINLQQKLLRVLQEQTIERVGGKEPIPVDVRVIAATHRDLEVAVQENQFRQDLYYRLNVAMISLPPLRERKEDLRDLVTNDPKTPLPGLVNYFVRRYATELGSAPPPVTEDAFQEVEGYDWPGNVRELRNVMRKALLVARGYPITAEIIRSAIAQTTPPHPSTQESFSAYVRRVLASAASGEREDVLADVGAVVERELYTQAVRRARGDQSKISRWLGVSRPTVRDKLTRFRLHPVKDAKGTP
jgi:DNA-binding NtrC family response regulator